MPQLTLSLLGRPAIVLDGTPVHGFESIKVRALLIYLAVEAEQAHSRDWLAELLWPDLPSRRARDNLRQALANLRAVLAERSSDTPFLLVTREQIQFNRASAYQLDLVRFQQPGTCRHHAQATIQVCPVCIDRLHTAAGLYRGEFLQQFSLSDSALFEEWAQRIRERAHQQALALCEQISAYHEARGAARAAEQYARRQLALEPWHEAGHRQLLRLLARRGQRQAALAHATMLEQSLRADLGIAPEAETARLIEQIRADSLPPLVSDTAALYLVPAALTTFIGRARERAALAALITEQGQRLLTVTGPPGVGKTRLALQIAADLRAHFSDGVVFVPLATTADPALVAERIVQRLGLLDTSGQTQLELLQQWARDKTLLLILDNFEQVAEAAPVLNTLLTEAARLVMLVTSRRPLRLYGEHEFEVAPLQLPDRQQPAALIEVLKNEAILLFVQRALAVRAGFAVTTENVGAVIEICHRVDGLPLAIELAAARSKRFAPAALLDHLGHRLTLLTGGPQDQPRRQQTLRDAIAWSYELLRDAERRLFARLAVFSGGTSPVAAEIVCGLDDADLEVVAGLETLADHHLLVRKEDLTGYRFMLLETVREYALEQLEAQGERTLLRDRHADYYLELALEGQAALRGADQVSWIGRLATEQENLRAAIQWAVSSGRQELAHRLVAALWIYWERHGDLSEARSWMGEVLQMRPMAAAADRAAVLDAAGQVALHLGNAALAQQWFDESEQIWRDLDQPAGRVWTLIGLGLVAQFQGDYARALDAFDQSLRLAQTVGDIRGMARALQVLGQTARRQGEYARARDYFAQSLAHYQTVGDLRGIAWILNNIGEIARLQGSYDHAVEHMETSLRLCHELGYKHGIAWAYNSLAEIARYQSNYARAAEYYELSWQIYRSIGAQRACAIAGHNLGHAVYALGEYEHAARLFMSSLIRCQKLGDTEDQALCLAGLAAVLAVNDAPAQATQVLSAVEAQLAAIQVVIDPVDRRAFDHALAAIREQLPAPAFDEAWTTGRQMSLDAATSIARAALPHM